MDPTKLQKLGQQLLEAAKSRVAKDYDVFPSDDDYNGYMHSWIAILAADLPDLTPAECQAVEDHATQMLSSAKMATRLLAAARKLVGDERPPGPKMTPQLQKLVADAKAAGYTVARRGSVLRIVKRQGKATRGLCVYENGTAVDLTNMQRSMRSYRDMRSCLGLHS